MDTAEMGKKPVKVEAISYHSKSRCLQKNDQVSEEKSMKGVLLPNW